MDILEKFFGLFKEIWSTGILGTGLKDLILAAGIFLIFLIFRGIFSKIILKRIENFTTKSSNQFDNTLVQALEGPIKFFPIVLGFFVASHFISASNKGLIVVENLNRSLVTLLIFWFFHQIIEPLFFLFKNLESLITKDLIHWIARSCKIIILVIGFAAILEIWGIKVGPIVAGLGLFGVAVALGAQDLFKNLISGILVLVEKRFKIGDVISVDSVVEGKVEKIGFRSTVIRRFDKSLCIIPNFQFAEKAVTNTTRSTGKRIDWIIGLEYKTSSDQIKNIKSKIEKFISASEEFLPDPDWPTFVKFDAFADSSINIRIRCYTKSKEYKEYIETKDKLGLEIKKIVEENKASFAFPSQSIYVEKIDK
jgi:MscS family membrane protein